MSWGEAEGEAGSQTGPHCATLGRSQSSGPFGLEMEQIALGTPISSSGLLALPALGALRSKGFSSWEGALWW